MDIGGAIVWTDVAGNASSAPGAGARPDSDSSTVVSRSVYRAMANGTGFASGDYLDRIVVVDGDAGDVISAFWLNATAGTRISAPSSASITPLPDGASTAERQDTANTSLAMVAGGIGDPADTIYGGSGGASIISALKGLYARLGAVVLATGTAVIGKVGLQVDGSEVANTNPVPVRFRAATTYAQDASGQIGGGSRFDGPLKAADPRYASFNAAFQCDKAATAAIYASVDGGVTAGVLVWSKALAAGEATTVRVPVVFSHFQTAFTAGPEATVIQMNSGFSVS